MNFLHEMRLALTPLSPIHIGCGEDFEPTRYVIENGLLYGFDPARAQLPGNLGKRLGELGEKADLLGIQRFFREHAAQFKPHADTLIPVAQGLAADYQRQVGQIANRESNGNHVFNQLFIERASHTGNQPYIPGSSVKGVLRTAWLDELNGGKPVADAEEWRNGDGKKLEKRLLQGDFATSPLRLIKPSDLMPVGDIARQVLYAVNLKKDMVPDQKGNERLPRGVTSRKECILPGQYRAFTGTVILQDLGQQTYKLTDNHTSKLTPPLRLSDFTQLARYVNTYHRPRLIGELGRLDSRGLLDPTWKKAIETLLATEIDPLLQSGQAMLIRLGRYGGAESKTLSGEGVARIKIMQGKGQPASHESHTKTVWLAAHTSTDKKHLLPFGWALIEINPPGELPQLRAWCEQQATARPDMAEIRQRFAAAQAAAAALAAQRRAEQEAAQAAEQAREAAEAERLARLQSLSPNLKAVETFIDECRKRQEQLRGGKDKPNTTYHNKAAALAKDAREKDDWTPAEKIAAADAIETWLPQIVTLDIKDMRKNSNSTPCAACTELPEIQKTHAPHPGPPPCRTSRFADRRLLGIYRLARPTRPRLAQTQRDRTKRKPAPAHPLCRTPQRCRRTLDLRPHRRRRTPRRPLQLRSRRARGNHRRRQLTERDPDPHRPARNGRRTRPGAHILAHARTHGPDLRIPLRHWPGAPGRTLPCRLATPPPAQPPAA